MIRDFFRNTTLSLAVLVTFFALTVLAQNPPKMKMTTPIPASIETPDKVETRLGTLKFFDGFPDDATVEKVYDNLDFERGVQAYLTAIPGASVYGLREGFRSQGADNNQTVLIMENLLDSKSLFLTANTETVYNLMWLDLKNGPLVIASFLRLVPGIAAVAGFPVVIKLLQGIPPALYVEVLAAAVCMLLYLYGRWRLPSLAS